MGRLAGQPFSADEILLTYSIGGGGIGNSTGEVTPWQHDGGIVGSLTQGTNVVPFNCKVVGASMAVFGTIPGSGELQGKIYIDGAYTTISGLLHVYPSIYVVSVECSIDLTQGQEIRFHATKTVSLNVAATNVAACLRLRRS